MSYAERFRQASSEPGQDWGDDVLAASELLEGADAEIERLSKRERYLMECLRYDHKDAARALEGSARHETALRAIQQRTLGFTEDSEG